MALYKISMGAAMGGDAPVPATIPSKVQTLTANGTTTIEAEGGEYITIYADTACHVDIGGTPSAGTSSGYAIAAGATANFGPAQRGDKVAIVAIV